MTEKRDPTVRVWDLPTRLFHWGLVGAVAAAFVTGEVLEDQWMAPHYWIGYAIAGLLLFRLAWGFFGSEHSRFASFAYGPRRVLTHLRDLAGGRARHYLGHNPAGAAMVFALLTLLALLTVSGLLAQGGAERAGPLAGWVGYRVGDAAGEVHEALFAGLLVLVAGHVAGVLLESLLSRQNLVRAMVTGRKARPAGATDPRPARPVAALVTLAAFAAALGWALTAAAGQGPAAAAPRPAVVADACGECHGVYPPDLLPAPAWWRVMQGLEDHYGEDASLDDDTRHAVAAYLFQHAAERADTKAAHRFRDGGIGGGRIAESPAWRHLHDDVPDAAFRRKSVGSRANCFACHRDAAAGVFALHNIHVPGE